MELRLKTADRREMRRIKKIYLEAFPKSERKPFGMMKRKARKGVMEFLCVMDGQKTVGLAITVFCRDMVLLDYFAMSRASRGKSYGSGALALLKERYRDRRLILEIELLDEHAPNSEDRIRRKRFYLKNGMKETGIRALVFKVPMEVLTAGESVSYEEYHEIYDKVIGPVFARKITRMEDEER